MYAIREIVTRDIFKNFEVPKEFGDEFEMILIPTKEQNHAHIKTTGMVRGDAYSRLQEENGFAKAVLAQECEDVWNDL